jgi:hypothetical protein
VENEPLLPGSITDETLARTFLESLDQEATEKCHNRTLQEWILASDISPSNRINAVCQYFENENLRTNCI